MLKLDDFKEFEIKMESKIFGGGIPSTWSDSHHGTSGTDMCDINEHDDGIFCVFYDYSDVC